MAWTDNAILINVTPQDGGSLHLHVLTEKHGRLTCKLNRAESQKPILMPGCNLRITLGDGDMRKFPDVTLEEVSGGISDDAAEATSVAVLTSMRAVMSVCLPTSEPVPEAFDYTRRLIGAVADLNQRWPVHYCQWEFALLMLLGQISGLERGRNAFRHGESVYMSPKSARMVTRAEAGAFLDRMLPLPGFLLGRKNATMGEVQQALDLCGSILAQMAKKKEQEIDRSLIRQRLDEIEEIPSYNERRDGSVDEDSFRRRLLSLRPLRVYDSGSMF